MLRPRSTGITSLFGFGFGSASVTALASVVMLAAGCSSTTASGEPRQTVIRPNESAPQTGGIAPDREAEIQLLLQQRTVSIHKCYQDALNARNDRNFAGSVKVVIALGTDGHARDVRIAGGTLPQSEVQPCLVETIRNFEFPTLSQPGDVQSEFQFKPAY
jgi:hypothetical protein